MKSLCFLLGLIAVLVEINPINAATIFVNSNVASSKNSGKSWAAAFKSLQDALAAANPGDEIWVAKGTYKPDQGAKLKEGDRTLSFRLVEDVGIYGGFTGKEIRRGQRDWDNNKTRLSGNIGSTKQPSDNSYHVVLGANNAILDGFIITSGNANGETVPDDRGGAIYNKFASPTLSNCTFVNNSAFYAGGAIFNQESFPTIVDCTFTNNSSLQTNTGRQEEGSGGAIANVNLARPDIQVRIIQCQFNNNTATGNGGAIFDLAGFGGTTNRHQSIVINHSVFQDNTANTGGALFFTTGSTSVISRCAISGNTARIRGGGGIYTEQDALIDINHSVIAGNIDQGGVGGGGVSLNSGLETTIRSCTIINNQAILGGGIISRQSPTRISDSIVRNNSAPFKGDNVLTSVEAPFTISHSNIQGSGGSDNWNILFGVDGGHNIDRDPRFVNLNDPDGKDGIFATRDDGLRLGPGSPCINSGESSKTTEEDIIGNNRPMGGFKDMGAYEFLLTTFSKRYSVSGTVSYSGSQAGPIIVQAWTNAALRGNLIHTMTLPQGRFTYTFQSKSLFTGTYFFTAFMDVNRNKRFDVGEPLSRRHTPRIVNNNLAKVTVKMIDTRRTIYVDKDATGRNGGSSWADAYTELYVALNNGIPGQEIWVATGTYTPTNSSDRHKSFRLREGVKLYGGFIGNEIKRTQRKWKNNLTILSGDINTLGNSEDNSYHVIIGANNATLDGFVISDGNADGDDQDGRGAGIYNVTTSPTIRNCSVKNNSAHSGAGMWNFSSSPAMDNCIFENNHAERGHGGGIYNTRSSSPVMTDCTFINNRASAGGGGMINEAASSPSLTHCIFSENVTVSGRGGGLENTGSSPTLIGCVFYNNTANTGGGIYNRASSPQIVNCTVVDNLADTSGGGMYNTGRSDPIGVINSILWNNRAINSGAEVLNVGFIPITFTHCIIKRSGGSENWNLLLGLDGGLNIDSDPFFLATADPNGPDNLWATADDGLRIRPGSPCIDTGTASDAPSHDLIGISRPQSDAIDIGAYEFEFSEDLVYNVSGELSYSGKQKGPVVIQLWKNSQFLGNPVDQISLSNGQSEYTLSSVFTGTYYISAFIDANNNGQFDLGEPRGLFPDPIILTADMADIDLVQVDTSKIIYVNQQASGKNNGSSWKHAFQELSDALFVATPGQEIWVAAGTYTPRTGVGRRASFIMRPGVDLYGGFSSSGVNKDQRDWFVNKTMLSGDLDGINGKSYHVVLGANDAVLDGFIITHGSANGAEYPHDRGGGMLNPVYSPIVRNCVFIDNSSENGGGISNITSSASFTHCIITGNKGNGVANIGFPSPMFEFCSFTHNQNWGITNERSSPQIIQCNFVGGGISNNNSSNPLITSCLFTKNETAIRNAWDSFPSIDGSRFYNNSALHGGAIDNFRSGCHIQRSFFENNSATGGGGSIVNFVPGSRPSILENSIFSYNNADDEGGAINNVNAIMDIHNCLFIGNRSTVGGVLANQGSVVNITDSILWENTAVRTGPVSNRSSVTAISSSIIEESGGSGANWNDAIGIDGGDNRDDDPALIPDGHLLMDSVAIDAGNRTALEMDHDQETRPHGSRADIGADEFIDDDGDGLPNWLELQITGTLRGLRPQQDNDDDGLTNLEEYELATNPANPDTDLDGRIDGDEVLEANTDPRHTDSSLAPFRFHSTFLPNDDRVVATVIHSHFVDVDADGDFDLVVGTSEGTIKIYENNGTQVTPNWDDPNMDPILLSVEIFGPFAVGDVDKDGDADIVATSGTHLMVLENHGDGSWNEPNVLFKDIPFASHPYVVDSDQDSDMDIVLVDIEGQMTLVENTGRIRHRWADPNSDWAGSTIAAQTFETLADLDLDGDLDRFAGLDRDDQPVIERNTDEHLLIFPRYLTLVEGESIVLEAVQGQENGENHGDVIFSIVQNESINPELENNGSDGVRSTAIYTAGRIDDGRTGVDVIKGVAEDGTVGLVVINVISSNLADIKSKVLIVVGTRSVEDTLFPVSERLAMDAYAVCRQRGFPADAIRLLTPSGGLSKNVHRGWPIQAFADNGELGNILNDSWARSADDLIVYFADHGIVGREGSKQVGRLLLQPGEPPLALSSTELKAMLDSWQTGSKRCLVIIDTCYSGHFVNELQERRADPIPNRIVLASSRPGQLAHFQASGRISFSQLFWDEIDAANTVGDALKTTQLTLAPRGSNDRGFSQNPTSTFDFDGNGVNNIDPGEDLNRHIGLEGLLSGVERPVIHGADLAQLEVIQESSAGEELDHSVDVGDTVTVWVDSVQSNTGVSKVIAYIAPPSLDTNVDGGSALTGMDNIELTDYVARLRIRKGDFEAWLEKSEEDLTTSEKQLLVTSYKSVGSYYELNVDDVSEADKRKLRAIQEANHYPPRYEADLDQLDDPGVYQILYFAEDNWGMLSPPQRIPLTVEGPSSRAIIIEGTGENSSVDLWEDGSIERLGSLAYQTLKRRNFKDNDIQWLANPFGHGSIGKLIDAPANRFQIRSAFLFGFDGGNPRQWDEAPPQLVIYIVGNHAIIGKRSGILLENGELITPTGLHGALDEFQGQEKFSDTQIIVIVESDRAGEFLLQPAEKRFNRIVITSSDKTEPTLRNGDTTFGRWFWGEVRRNRSIREAVANTIQFARASGFDQVNDKGQFEPLFFLDDDGSGNFVHKQDGQHSQDQFIGSLLLTGDTDAQIFSVNEPIQIQPGPDASILIWAKVFAMATDLPLNVWATIFPEEGDMGSIKKVRMCFNEVNQRYEVEIKETPAADCPVESGFSSPAFSQVGFNASGHYIAVIHAEPSNKPEKAALPVAVDIAYGVPPERSAGIPNYSYPRLVPGEDPIEAKLSKPDKGDVYRVWVAKGKRITVKLTALSGDPAPDLMLDILRPGPNNTDIPVFRIDDWGPGIEERLWSWEPADSGWIYLKVSEFKPRSDGIRYSLTVTVELGSGPDGFEVDNCPAQASSVSLLGGEFQVHNFHVADDEDWVVFFREQGHSYDVDIKNVGINFSGVIQLYAETPILRMSCPYNEKRFSPLPNSTVVLNNQDSASLQVPNTKSGNIYVRIKNNSKNSGLGTNYQISVHDTTGEFKPVQIFLRSGDNRPLIGQVCKTECRSCRPPTALCKNNNRFDVRGDITVNLPDEKCHQIRAFFSGQEHPQPAECQQYGGETNLETFTFKNVTTQTINFNRSGWHHISLNVQPGDRSPEAIFGAILGNVERIDHNNEFFLKDNAVLAGNDVNFNTLNQLEDGKGYWIKLSSSSEPLEIPGIPIDPATEISLSEGWNNVGYILQEDKAIEIALTELIATGLLVQVQGVQDNDDVVFIPDGTFNTLNTLTAGSGYWIEVMEDISFSYR